MRERRALLISKRRSFWRARFLDCGELAIRNYPDGSVFKSQMALLGASRDQVNWVKPLFIAELRLSLFYEGGHAFRLIFCRK